MPAMLAAGAARFVANLFRGGLRRAQVRRRLLARFPNSADRSIEAVIDRARAAMQAAELLNAKDAGTPLRANETRPPDRGCTNWRYYFALQWAHPTSGESGWVSDQITDTRSLSRDQVEAAAVRMFNRGNAARARRWGRYGIPNGAVAGQVVVITVERACPE